MNLPEQRSDDDLVAQLAGGDASASATLAQRYAPGIYDFAIRVTLDPATAASVTEAALNRAKNEISTRPNSLSFHAWLFGIVRDESLEGLRQRARGDAAPEEAVAGALAPMDARFLQSTISSHEETTAWAWSAARGQRPRDYSILDLLLRRKITPEEVAEIASLSRNGVYAVLGRLRGGFEESFIAAALYSSGRQVCSDLDALLGDAISLGPAIRREISRHAENCPRCKETRAKLPSAADVFAGLQDVEMPDEVSDQLLPLMLAGGAAVAATELAQEDTPTVEPENQADAGSDEAGALPGVAMAGAAAAAAGFATNGAEALSEAAETDGESDSEALSEEPEAAQASLFEAEADTTESEVDLAEQPLPAEEPALDALEEQTEEAPPQQEAALPPAAELEAAAPDAESFQPEEQVAPTADDVPETASNIASASVAEPVFSEDIDEMETETASASQSAFAAADDADLPDEESNGYSQDSSILNSSPFTLPAPVFGDEPEASTAEDNTLDADEPLPAAALFANGEEERALPRPTPSGEAELSPAASAVFGEAASAETTSASTASAVSTPVTGNSGSLLAATAAAANAQRRRTAQAGDGSGSPPSRRGPFDGPRERESGGGKKKYLVYAVVAGVSLAALYLGVAFGDALRGGGNGTGNSVAALPTRVSDLSNVACPGPVQVNQGGRVALAFANVPSGYTLVANPGVRPVSPTSAVGQVTVSAQADNTVLFGASSIPDSAGRTDEYEITAVFARGSDRESMRCNVHVLGAPAQPTATAPAATPSATPEPEATATPPPPPPPPPPTATFIPVFEPTSTAIPTETPDLSTPTPDLSTPTTVPTAGGVLISPTETATPEPPSPTPGP